MSNLINSCWNIKLFKRSISWSVYIIDGDPSNKHCTVKVSMKLKNRICLPVTHHDSLRRNPFHPYEDKLLKGRFIGSVHLSISKSCHDFLLSRTITKFNSRSFRYIIHTFHLLYLMFCSKIDCLIDFLSSLFLKWSEVLSILLSCPKNLNSKSNSLSRVNIKFCMFTVIVVFIMSKNRTSHCS